MPRTSRSALIASGACLAGLATTGAVALLSPYARAHDTATLSGFTVLSHTRAATFADAVARLVDPPGYIVLLLLLGATALARGRPRVALAVPAMMLLAVGSAELLKPLVDASRSIHLAASNVGDGSWPSGHATAAMAAALGAVIAVPRTLRPLAAALGTALTVGVSYSVLLLSWHFPSDVLGGLLLAAAWGAGAVALLRWADARWPSRAGRAAISRGLRHPIAPALAVLALLGTAIAEFVTRGEVDGAAHIAPASFTLAAIGIAMLAGAIAAALAFALRR